MKNFIKQNLDGIKILSIFLLIIIFGLTGVFDYILEIIIAIFFGFRNGGIENYIPGENFPLQ